MFAQRRKIAQTAVGVTLIVLVFFTVNGLGKEKTFPARPINVYIGFGPGGGSHTTGSVICEGLKTFLGQFS